MQPERTSNAVTLRWAGFLMASCFVVVPTASPGPRAAENHTVSQQSGATVPLTSRGGFTVDVPADWRISPPGFDGDVSALAPDNWGRVKIVDEPDVTVVTTVVKMNPNLQSIAHKDGTIAFRKDGRPPRVIYTIWVRLGDRAAQVTCNESPETEQGASGCLTIIRTSRLTSARAGRSDQLAAPSPPVGSDKRPAVSAPSGVVPLRNLAGFTVDVPADWRQVEMGGSARIMRATSPDNIWMVILPDVDATSEAAARAALTFAKKGSPGYDLFEHPQGSIVRHSSQTFSVVLGERAGRLTCTGQTTPEKVLSECLAIARTARFVGSSGGRGAGRAASRRPKTVLRSSFRQSQSERGAGVGRRSHLNVPAVC